MIDYDPFSKEARTDSLPLYARLRDEAPVYYIPKYDAWALSRFQDIWDCSSDPRFSTEKGTTPAQVLTKDQPVTAMLNVMDPPGHTKLRAAIRKCFLPKHLKALEPVARSVFSGLVDEVFERGECDLIQDLAAKLSVQVACLAIGLPVEDGPLLTNMVSRFFAHDPGRQGITDDGLAALQELTDYCAEQARERRKTPGTGPEALDALVQFELSGRRFSDEEIASHLTMLVIGGSETFPKTLANGIVRLWEHRDQRSALVANPSGIPDAYNEILRYDMPTQFLCRTLTDDIELHSRDLRAGQAVLFLYASANRDHREFDDPDRFDTRRCAKRFLTFGAGTHACLGTHVARMEGQITLETILSRMPNYEVDLDNAERLRAEFVQGYSKLPIRF